MSGVGGMHRELIRAVPIFHKRYPRYDCILAEKDSEKAGFEGLHAARVLLLFSFFHERQKYECALVHWFSPIDDEPSRVTNMWVVEPDRDNRGKRVCGVIPIGSILRGAHLLPVFGEEFIPLADKVNFTNSLNCFRAYYVNKFADHHSHEVVF